MTYIITSSLLPQDRPLVFSVVLSLLVLFLYYLVNLLKYTSHDLLSLFFPWFFSVKNPKKKKKRCKQIETLELRTSVNLENWWRKKESGLNICNTKWLSWEFELTNLNIRIMSVKNRMRDDTDQPEHYVSWIRGFRVLSDAEQPKR